MTFPDVRRVGAQWRAVIARGDGTRWYGPCRSQPEVAAADAALFRARRGLQPLGADVPCTMAEAFSLLLAELQDSGARAGTIAQHRQRWSVITSDGQHRPKSTRKRAERPVSGWDPAYPITEIRPESVQRWARARSARGVSASTIWGGDIAHLRRLIGAALRAGRIKTDPLANLTTPSYRKRQFSCLSAEQVRRLVEQVRASRSMLADRDAAMIEFLFATGLRRAELARLRRMDIDFDLRRVRVDGKTGPRTLPLSDLGIAAARVLFEDREPDEPCVRTAKTIEQMFARTKRRTGVHVSPHVLRHSFATACAANGVDPFTLSKLLGHSRLEQSLRYVHESGALSAAAVAGVGASYGHRRPPSSEGA